jgi:probable F420-dependent oxidoreductase
MEWWLNLSFTSFADYLALAQAAERHGFAGVVLSDHLITPIDYDSTYPYAPADAPRWPVDVEWPDCWVTIAALAMGTTRLRFATAVYVAPLREPIALAKSIGTAAILSGYRLACGFGAGWLREEFDAVGVAFPSRGRRLDEMLTVMTTLWHGDSPGHAGDHFRHPAAVMHPRPQQHIPIYVGGHGEAALARAARHDGWIAAHQDAERTAAAWPASIARLRRATATRSSSRFLPRSRLATICVTSTPCQPPGSRQSRCPLPCSRAVRPWTIDWNPWRSSATST